VAQTFSLCSYDRPSHLRHNSPSDQQPHQPEILVAQTFSLCSYDRHSHLRHNSLSDQQSHQPPRVGGLRFCFCFCSSSLVGCSFLSRISANQFQALPVPQGRPKIAQHGSSALLEPCWVNSQPKWALLSPAGTAETKTWRFYSPPPTLRILNLPGRPGISGQPPLPHGPRATARPRSGCRHPLRTTRSSQP